MIDMELGVVQERFADLVWDNEPIASGELVKICEKELKWKKSTTYTVLRKLCDKVQLFRLSREEILYRIFNFLLHSLLQNVFEDTKSLCI